MLFKLTELHQIPEKLEQEKVVLQKKLDKLEGEKQIEEEKLKEVMESLKTETQVSQLFCILLSIALIS